MDSSRDLVGQLYPVLRDAEGKIIDGKHRLDSDPNWFSRVLPEVKTEEQRILVAFHANVGRRSIPVEEKRQMINALAEIYLARGLKVKVNSVIKDKDGRNKHISENEITQKLSEDLKGLVGKSTILKLLDSKFKDGALSEAMREAAQIRRDGTPAYKLIKDSFGKHISRAFGPGIFERMKREMIEDAKERLIVDERFMRRMKRVVKKEVRAEVEAAVAEEAKILEEGWSIEKQNFFNMTDFYSDEIKLVVQGKKTSEAGLDVQASKALRKAGVLRGQTNQTYVSFSAKFVLGLVPGVVPSI